MGGESRSGYVYVCAKDIKQVQDEAFLAGQLDGLRQGKETAMKVIDEVFSKKV